MSVAKECCGSCEHYVNEVISTADLKPIVSRCSEGVILDFDYNKNIKDCYSPRHPIKSKHEKMWDELRELTSIAKTEREKHQQKTLLNIMKLLEQKHK